MVYFPLKILLSPFRQMKQMQTDTSEQARVEREGMAVLKIKMADLFAVRGETVSVKMSREANNLKEFKVFVSLENRLMSEELSRVLNPIPQVLTDAHLQQMQSDTSEHYC